MSNAGGDLWTDLLPTQWEKSGGEEDDEESSLKQILAAIQGDHFEELKLEFSFLKHNVQKVMEKAKAVDKPVASLEDIVRPTDTAVQVAKKTLSDHTLKMADMEDRMCWNNIHLVGFPKGAEGRHPAEFLKGWLKDHLALRLSLICLLLRGLIDSWLPCPELARSWSLMATLRGVFMSEMSGFKLQLSSTVKDKETEVSLAEAVYVRDPTRDGLLALQEKT